MLSDGTIIALASPIGSGAIGLIRISGTQAFKKTALFFRSKSKKKFENLSANTSHLGDFVVNKKLIDEVKAYNSKTTTANKTRNVGGAAVRAKNLMEQQKRTKKNRNVSGRNKPKTTKSRTAKPRK